MRGADGREYGPVSQDQLEQWIREGRANGQTEIRKDGGTFLTLSALPEFSGPLSGNFGGPTMAVPATSGSFQSGGYSGMATAGADVVRTAAAPLADASFWMKLVGIITIIQGAVTCIGIITAIIGVPLIFMGLGAYKAANNAKLAASNGDALALTEMGRNLKTYFLIWGIFTLLILIFYAIYFVVIVIAITSGGYEFADQY